MALHHARQLIRENELLIVDGQQGVVIVNPDKQILAEYKLRQSQWEIERQKLKRLKSTPPPRWTARRWNCTPISNCRRISRR